MLLPSPVGARALRLIVSGLETWSRVEMGSRSGGIFPTVRGCATLRRIQCSPFAKASQRKPPEEGAETSNAVRQIQCGKKAAESPIFGDSRNERRTLAHGFCRFKRRERVRESPNQVTGALPLTQSFRRNGRWRPPGRLRRVPLRDRPGGQPLGPPPCPRPRRR